MSTQSVCNICGANYEYRNGRWKCPACGAFKAEELSSEEATLLYNAAQKLRLSNFSEAEEAYSDIIEKYPRNANAYWGRLLAKYGIKYEEDFDGRKIPTCYAASIESVVADSDYLNAIEFADAETREYFELQADYIERVRKEWINKAQKEKPYDVFICYKDSDLEKGIERTSDSIEAQELYIHLTNQGYRVFYSRESLRDKVGEKYEPYIFNALSTAKVMLVYGSSAEYIKSTWLKNEWHRYYKKIVAGEKHQESLIVACDGFSPSELPTILSSRQCLDAKRKTFYSDLDKCIRRIIQESPEYSAPSPKKEEAFFSGLHEHTYKTKVVKATCIAKGYTIHRCDCGYEYKDTYTPLVDHSFKVDERVEPTCTKDGYEKKTCKICGESITDKLSAFGHQFSKWVETKHPTCTEDGEAQRQCTRCGHIEKKPIPKTGHQYSSWMTNADGTQTCDCINCGHTQTRANTAYNYYHPNTVQEKPSSVKPWTLFWLCLFGGFIGLHKFAEKKIGKGILYYCTAGLFYVGWITDCVKYYKNAKYGSQPPIVSPIVEEEQTIRFKDILRNFALYWKSFFTKRTTKIQKVKHWLGCGLLLTFMLMFAISIIASYSDGISGNPMEIQPYWVLILFVGFTAYILIASIAVPKEKKSYLEQELMYPHPVNNRIGMRIVSNVLLFMTTLGVATMFADNQTDRNTGLIMTLIFSVWTVIATLYTHCPKEYKRIRFTENAKPVRRINLIWIGITLTFVLIIVLGILGGTAETPQ